MVDIILDGTSRVLKLGENTDLALLAASSAAASVATVSGVASSLADWTAKSLTYTKGQRVKTDGTTETAAGYAVFGCAIDSSDQAHRITVFGVASGYKTASYYSDPAGSTATFISASTEGGGALQTQLTLTPPSNARYVRINSYDFPNANYTVPVYETKRTITTATTLADTRARLLTASSVPLATSPTVTTSQRVNADGSLTTASGYGNALVVLDADTTALVIDTWVLGTGNPAIVWYSDAAGTTILYPGSQIGGAPVQVQATIARPAGAASARVAFATANSYSIRRQKRIVSVEEVLQQFGLTSVATSLTSSIRQTPPGGVLASTRIAPSTGATESAAGYSAAFFPVTDLSIPMQASGQVLGSSRCLATYYSDSGGTVYLGQEWAGAVTRNKVTLNPPAGTLCIGINGTPSVPPQLFQVAIPTGIGAKFDVVDRLTSTFAGKKLGTEGDSITANNNWQAALVQRLGMAATYSNTGVGGTRVAYLSPLTDQASCMCDDARVNAIPSDVDVLIFMAGVNDFRQSVPLGAITGRAVRASGSLDPYTFYGALELAALKHKTRFPAKRILWAGQTYTDRNTTSGGWADSLTNPLGLTQWDYAAAVEAVALKWGIPFVNMIRECGWDTTNIATFITNEGGTIGYTHPNQVGANVMAGVFFGRLRSLEAIV